MRTEPLRKCRLPSALSLSVLSVLSVLSLLSLLAASSHADDFRPLYVEVRTLADSSLVVRIKPPAGRSEYALVTPGLPDFCTPNQTPAGPKRIYRYQCAASIEGATLHLQYPGFLTPLPAVVRIIQSDGNQQTLTLPAHEQTWIHPADTARQSVAFQYLVLGIEHILIGYDHLLFLLCVVWIARTGKRILWMVTGFTIAHSITLSLATFQLVRLNIGWVETSIALSVLFLALEITRNRRNTLTWQYPATISALFGLLHGFGFASVLSEIGLPDQERVQGLLFFNIGVEIGQLTFVAASLLTYHVIRKLAGRYSRYADGFPAQLACGYGVGCVAAFWFIERLASLTA